MYYTIRIVAKTLHFKQPAGTSRGIYTHRKVWYLLVEDDQKNIGVGECAPLPLLSCDDLPTYEEVLYNCCKQLALTGQVDREALEVYPSILMGIETVLQHLQQLQQKALTLWDSPFSRSKTGIYINGLIWMGNYETMKQRIEEKMEAGFHCIKLKIGAIDFQQELRLLELIRTHFTPSQIELRVDANGAFSPAEAKNRLQALAQFSIHSIEQPIAAGQWEEMAELCATTSLPIALDEELIGIHGYAQKKRLLQQIAPQYIIIKPTLHGSFYGAKQWIDLAKKQAIPYWVTSALESNLGLNAIAQWCATMPSNLPQGLGTGLLFTDNIEMPLTIRGEQLYYTATRPIDVVKQVLTAADSISIVN